jgi:hypothetical protein
VEHGYKLVQQKGALLGYYEASVFDYVPSFRRQPVRPIFLDYYILEDGSDRMYRKVGKELPQYTE